LSGAAPAWAGTLFLGTGWAMLDARIGASRPHAHLAHQLSLAVDRTLHISGEPDLMVPRGRAALVPARLVHRLGPVGARVRSLYVDPLLRGQAPRAWPDGPILLDKAVTTGLAAIAGAAAARDFALSFVERSAAPPPDPRLRRALAHPEPAGSPRLLAQRAGLSPSRLREIVLRDTGVPPAKLIQWHQLLRAIAALRETGSLAEAAIAGGFADQSHFTRRCVQWFGVTPSAGLASFSIEISS
jgi:AraC-like DNA-binding protein